MIKDVETKSLLIVVHSYDANKGIERTTNGTNGDVHADPIQHFALPGIDTRPGPNYTSAIAVRQKLSGKKKAVAFHLGIVAVDRDDARERLKCCADAGSTSCMCFAIGNRRRLIPA